MMDMPAPARSRMMSCTRSAWSSVSAAVGSSNRSSLGLADSARAISSSCLSARLKLPASRSAPTSPRPTCVRFSAASAWSAARSMMPRCRGRSRSPTFSATLRLSMIDSSCEASEIPAANAADAFAASYGTPSSWISPLSRAVSPVRTFSKVDFPAPFSPTRAWISPSPTSRLTSLRTGTA